jgi:hypothetical protein
MPKFRARRDSCGFDRGQNTARRDRGFIDLGPASGEGVADSVGDRRGWGYRSAFSHVLFIPYSVYGVGMWRWPILIAGISTAPGSR